MNMSLEFRTSDTISHRNNFFLCKNVFRNAQNKKKHKTHPELKKALNWIFFFYYFLKKFKKVINKPRDLIDEPRET